MFNKEKKPEKMSEPFVFELFAWLALLFENNWTGFLLPLSVISLFAATAFFDIFISVGAWGHLALLSMFSIGFTYSIYRFYKNIKLPNWQNARRRLERKSSILHRPLTTALDDLPQDSNNDIDPIMAAAWKRHQKKAESQIDNLNLGTIESDSARIDRYAIRALILLIFIISVFGSWGRWQERLNFAVFPDLHAYGLIKDVQLDAWIDPPDYTNIPPISLATAQKMPLEDDAEAIALNIPENSLLMAHINGGRGVPYILYNDNKVEFQTDGENLYILEYDFTDSGILEIWQRSNLYGRWQINVVADTAPLVSFTDIPSATEDAVLKIPYEANDDYGLSELNLTIELDSTIGNFNGEDVISLPINIGNQNRGEIKSISYQDLASHIWAGEEVSIQLIATDTAMQVGESEVIMMSLPERIFTNPVAIAIIAARKDIIKNGNIARTSNADTLFDIATETHSYNNEITVFLALRMAANRLYIDYSPTSLNEIQSLLWETAIHIEDGKFGLAANDLREAQENLAEALADENSSDAEIRQLMNELQDAMQNYMLAMQEEMMKRYQSGEQMPLSDEDMANMEVIDWSEMMQNMRDMAELGARSEAMDMLNSMQQQMEMMRSGMNQPFDPERMRQAEELMNSIEDIIEQQRDLLDNSHEEYAETPPETMPEFGMRQIPILPILPPANLDQQPDIGDDGGNSENGDNSENGSSPPPLPPQNMGGGKGSGGKSTINEAHRSTQENIRRELGELMLRSDSLLGEIPQNFSDAEQAMRGAEDALEKGDGNASLPFQSEALQALSDGANEMQNMMQGQMPMMMGIGIGQGMGQGMRRGGQGEDPFGRNGNGRNTARDGVEVPEEVNIRRAREILEEIHHRASDFTKPQEERDYLNRLMRRF